MHHIHHTEGIILGSGNYGETSKFYTIFTRDFGLIFASAQAVRKLSSKLRFVLQDFSYIKVDLIKGKDYWRITSASKTNKLENLLEKDIFQVYINILKLLKRLLAGEEKNEELFDDLIEGFLILEKSSKEEELRNIEAVIVLRILSNLGYIGGDNINDFIKSPFEQELIFRVSKNRADILHHINKALKETHL